MSKRPKAGKKAEESPPPTEPLVAYPPARRPWLLAASIVLFALWLVFLAAAALWY